VVVAGDERFSICVEDEGFVVAAVNIGDVLECGADAIVVVHGVDHQVIREVAEGVLEKGGGKGKGENPGPLTVAPGVYVNDLATADRRTERLMRAAGMDFKRVIRRLKVKGRFAQTARASGYRLTVGDIEEALGPAKTVAVIGIGPLWRQVMDALNTSPVWGSYEKLIYVDEPALQGKSYENVKIVGMFADFLDGADEPFRFTTIVLTEVGHIRRDRFECVRSAYPKIALFPLLHESAIVSPSSRMGSSTFIGRNVTIDDNTYIGSCSVLEGDVHVGRDVVVGRNCHIRRGAILCDRCIVGGGSTIGEGAVVQAERVVDQRVDIPAGEVVKSGRRAPGGKLA